MMHRYDLARVLPLAVSILIFPATDYAQTYPARTVRIVVPFPAGTGLDFTTRLFAPKLTEALQQQFIVDNRAGAASTIGAEAVARSAPDGYTLLAASASTASSQSLYKNLSYDLGRDFEPIAMLTSAPFVLVVHPSLPARNITQLVALAKARPGQLTFASSGSGSSPHLTGELFRMQARIDMIHVPYKGSPQALTDVMGGEVSMMFSVVASVLPQIKAGRLHALAISSAKRSVSVPELPTIAESGLAGFESGSWSTLLAPSGTPREIIARINEIVVKTGQTPEIRDRIRADGSEPLGGTPEEVGAYIRSEIAKWAKVIVASGARAD